MRAPIFAAFVLGTAACSGGQDASSPNAASAPESAGNRVAALSAGQRNAVFIRAIRDAGLECQHVEQAVPVGIAQNMPAWRATCQGGGEWTILIGPDGTAQILPEGTTTAGGQPAGNTATNGSAP